jgi:hypothetical protein
MDFCEFFKEFFKIFEHREGVDLVHDTSCRGRDYYSVNPNKSRRLNSEFLKKMY